jgi:hypothetical protein
VTADAADAAIAGAADALYGLPAAEFTAARDRRAAEARKAGDRELAAAIKKLRRPTASAALANRLVREHPDQVAALLGIGAALRDAQAQLAADELRRLSQEGQQIVAALSREARGVAGETGEPLSEQVGRELEETLHAALADPAAGDALGAGCLSTALHYSGFGLADTSDPLATAPAQPSGAESLAARRMEAPPAPVSPAPGPPARERLALVSPPALVPPASEPPDRHRDEIEAARHAVRDAEAQLAGAQADAADHEGRVREAREQRERLEVQIRQLSEQLERLRAEAEEVASRLRDAEQGLQRATAAVQAAAARLARAQADL